MDIMPKDVNVLHLLLIAGIGALLVIEFSEGHAHQTSGVPLICEEVVETVTEDVTDEVLQQ